MKSMNKKYNEDYKRTIVELYHSGQKVKSLSSEYGVSEVTIYNNSLRLTEKRTLSKSCVRY
nr:hypothetical protein [Brevibacillus laterosporus]